MEKARGSIATRRNKSQQSSIEAQTILVVEDEELVAEIIVELLEDEGYHVECAVNGQAALSSLESKRPDLILTDIMMPSIDGIAMCRTIQHSPLYRAASDVPVVLMSAVDAKVGKIECKYEAFIPKPFVLDELLAVVGRVLKEHSK